MLSSLNKLLTYWWIGIIMWCSSLGVVTCIYGTNNWIDFICTYNWNDSILSSYYLLWTNAQNLGWLLCILFIIVNYLYSHSLMLSVSHYVNFILIYVIVVFIELLDNTNLNWSPYELISVYHYSNPLLNNLLNRYHPLLFYTAVAFLINYCIVNYLNINNRPIFRYLNIKICWFNIYLCWLTLLSLTSIYLGAWWAFQEGNWGGWWNSDSSEMLGIVLILFVLLCLHKYDTWLQNNDLWLQSTSILLNFFAFYFFLQINYRLTSHNFDLKVTFFLNSNIFFEFGILLLILTNRFLFRWTHVLMYWIYRNTGHALTNKVKLQQVLIFSFMYLCLSWIFISLTPLLSMLIFQYKYEIGWGLYYYYSWILVLSVLVLVCTFWTVDVYFVMSAIIAMIMRLPSVLYMFFNFKIRIFNWTTIHWLISLFLFTNLITKNLIFIFFDISSCYQTTLLNNMFYFSQFLSYTCEGGYFYKNWLISDSLFTQVNIWTINSGSGYKSDGKTLLLTNKYNVENMYYLYDFLTLKLLYENSNTSNLNTIWLLMIIFIFRHLLSRSSWNYY